MQPDDPINNIPKITWACRRGMLELDVMLGHFLKDQYQSLDDDDKRLFINLLEYTDPELFDWLMGTSTPEDRGMKKIIEMIQTHARTRIRN